MEKSEEGKQVLSSRPNIHSDDVDLDQLASLEPDQLGRRYYEMLEKYSISPDTRVPVKFIEGDENQFIMKRFRQCHDLLHLLLDAPTNFEGECYVKGEYFRVSFFLSDILSIRISPNRSSGALGWFHRCPSLQIESNSTISACTTGVEVAITFQ